MAELEIPAAVIEQCTWSTDKICYVADLLKDDSQYITWVLVFFGWAITIIIAVVQWCKNSQAAKEVSHNEWVREFREKLSVLEDEALLFWTTTGQELSHTIALGKLTRSVKELTTIAREIQKVGGSTYQTQTFKELRQSVTNDREVDARPISDSHYRIVAIRKACSDLRRSYRRKSE